MDSSVYSRLAHLANPKVYHDDRNIYDNRLAADGESADLGAIGFASSDEERAFYYSAKFDYYATRLEALIASGCGNAKVEPNPDVPPEALAIWDAFFASEFLVYITRTLQAPHPVVLSTWYCALPAFERWAAAAERLVRDFDSRTIAHALSTNLPVCFDEEAQVLAFVRSGAQSLSASTDGLRPDAIVTARRSQRVGDLIARILDDLSAVLSLREADHDSALKVVVRAIRETFRVRICDLLSVTYGQLGLPVLDLSATSWDADDLEKVRGGEAVYSVGGGITGSVFLLERSDPVRWVCTNVLEADKRQSERHAEVYSHVYGAVSAFCVLPIYSGTTMIGALRLIDPTDLNCDDTLTRLGRPGTWPLEMRLELADLSEWLSAVLPVLRIALPGGDEESALAEVGRHPTWLEWASPRFKAAILRDSARIVSMRDEHRAVSAAVLAGNLAACTAFERATKSYPSIPHDRRQGPLVAAAGLFGRVLPGAGVFVCAEPETGDAYLTGCTYRNVQATATLSPRAAAATVKDIPNCALLQVSGESRVVHVFEKGEWSADYFVNEKLGRWQLRVRHGVERQVTAWVPRHVPVNLILWLLTQFVIGYSYSGHGGLILVANSPPREKIAEAGFLVGQPLNSMDAAQFSTIAAVDGGTWLDFKGTVREAGIIFESKPTGDPRRGGGARHQAAKTLAQAVKVGVVIAISANRPITMFSRDVDELPL